MLPWADLGSYHLQNEDEEEVVHSEGFWLELFLLKPEKPSLRRRFDALTPDHLLHFQVCQLAANSITCR